MGDVASLPAAETSSTRSAVRHDSTPDVRAGSARCIFCQAALENVVLGRTAHVTMC
ncbi:MAG: hypothetical protein JWN93_422 [Hyphomicrobiales bacterium]|nr:hypothetical protein [Hyphomicrobiales bacterium]